MSTEVVVTDYPECDVCLQEGRLGMPAKFDAKTKQGPWAYLCESDFDRFGIGLGLGQGQRLVLACKWFARCDNVATMTQPHPILGEVPICLSCAAWVQSQQ